MQEQVASEQNISLIGKSGHEYYGKIYDHENSITSLEGPVVVCLTNTRWYDNHWQHAVRDIYNDDARRALRHFRERDDISHLILLPNDPADPSGMDKIDDLRRRYIHQ